MEKASENPIRFGIIGCAEIARKVSRAISLAPNSILSTVSSRSIEKARNFAEKNGLGLMGDDSIKLYGSYDELLDDPTVDAVYLPLPTSLHLHWAILVARRKKHLLLEKPTALHVSELDKILEACEENGVQFMDASMWYHHPRTAKMKEFLSNPQLFGPIRSIQSSSSFAGTPEFLENNIRVKPELDGLGALGDVGWYSIGAILWAMDQKLPTSVTALPGVVRNSAGVILTCSAALHWEKEEIIATFYCSMISSGTMSLSVCALNGTLNVEDLIIPYEENSAIFRFTSGVKIDETGWNAKPQEVEVDNGKLPQEALMVQEFARLVKNIKFSGGKPEKKWPETSRMTQLVLDAVKNSIELGCTSVQLS